MSCGWSHFKDGRSSLVSSERGALGESKNVLKNYFGHSCRGENLENIEKMWDFEHSPTLNPHISGTLPCLNEIFYGCVGPTEDYLQPKGGDRTTDGSGCYNGQNRNSHFFKKCGLFWPNTKIVLGAQWSPQLPQTTIFSSTSGKKWLSYRLKSVF